MRCIFNEQNTLISARFIHHFIHQSFHASRNVSYYSKSSNFIIILSFNLKSANSLVIRFADNTNLWDNLISSATSVFTTQEGLDLVKGLYSQRKGEFGSAEHIIEKSIRNIKEETKWSDDNLPVIEKWLDNYLNNNNNAGAKFMG